MSDNSKHLPAALTRPVDGDVGFFGAITASVTHELNNVISIIDQTGGLFDDLIEGERRGVPLSIERLAGLSESIQKQTRRGLGIIERLNAFAHTTDRPTAEFDLNEVVGNIVELCCRLAELRKVELRFEAHPKPVMVFGNPMLVQQVVFESLRILLRESELGGTITVAVADAANEAAVNIAGESGVSLPESDLAHLTALMQQSGGAIALTIPESGGRLMLTIRKELEQ